MPSTYAHYRLGKETLQLLNGEVKKIIEENQELYQIGLHGPDILFYYRPLGVNTINRLGHTLHRESGKAFFRRGEDVIKKQEGSEKHLAYLYGVLCHFALDASCHGYIAAKIKASGISHAEIETEFDRSLMIKDGLDPISQSLTGHIVPSMENAEVISAFYEGISAAEMKKVLESFVFYHKILLAPSKLKRNLIFTLLRLGGQYKNIHGMIVNYQENPDCADSTARLWELYQEAVKKAVSMIEEFGREDWDKRAVYSCNFESEEADSVSHS